MPDHRWIFAIGAALAGLAVAAGAFGAHGLAAQVEAGNFTEKQLDPFHIAARNQMYHALALLVLGLRPQVTRLDRLPPLLFMLGIALFSGGLYGYVFTGAKPFVWIVPFGGFAFLIGWGLLAVSAFAKPRQ